MTIQFPSMAKSPSKRVSQALLAVSSSSPSWNEKPPWEQQDLHDEQIIIDSQISVSTKLTECPSTDVGIQLPEDIPHAPETVKNPEPVTHDEYDSCIHRILIKYKYMKNKWQLFLLKLLVNRMWIRGFPSIRKMCQLSSK